MLGLGPVSHVWISMASEAGTTSPETPELATGAPATDVSVDAMSAFLEAFVARVEAVRGASVGGGQKHPPSPYNVWGKF